MKAMTVALLKLKKIVASVEVEKELFIEKERKATLNRNMARCQR